MLKRRICLFVCVCSISPIACDARDGPALISQEDKVILARLKAKESARERLSLKPGEFIQAQGWEGYDSGFLKSYTQAVAIEFSNVSQFDVDSIEGQITFKGASGNEMATVPFKAHGEVPRGAKAKLKVESGEITGKAATAQFVVKVVRIRD